MLEMLRTLQSAISSRVALARQAGLNYGTDRDYGMVLGYPTTLDAGHYRKMYDRGDIAASIVEAKPAATWSDGIELIENEDPESETAFEAAFNELNTRLNIWSVLSRGDVLSGVGRYAVVLIGAPGKLETPLPTNLKPNQIVYFQVFGEEDAKIVHEDLEKNSENPRFMQPNFYRIKRLSENGQEERPVHWTRCVHIAENQLDDILYGQPRLERVYNQLINLLKVVGGGSEAFWTRVNPGIQFDLDPKAFEGAQPPKTGPGSIEDFKEQADDYVNGINRVLRTRGMKVNVLDAQVTDFKTNAEAIISLISGSTGIPQRILLGSERGELASSQDAANWDDRISDRRAQYAGPYIVRPFITRLIECGALPKPSVDLIIRWPDMKDLTEDQKAAIAEKMANANSKQISSFGEPILSSAEIRDIVWGLEPLDLTEWEAPEQQQDPNADEEDNLDDEEVDGERQRAAAAATNPKWFPRVLSQRAPYRGQLRGENRL